MAATGLRAEGVHFSGHTPWDVIPTLHSSSREFSSVYLVYSELCHYHHDLILELSSPHKGPWHPATSAGPTATDPLSILDTYHSARSE